MPNTSRLLRTQLGLDSSTYGYIPETVSILLPAGHKLGQASPLFTKIEDIKIEELRKKYGGKQENVAGKATGTPKIQKFDSVSELDAAIAKQGQLVRELKAKEDKSVWMPQVQVLQQLKKQLADLNELSTKTINSSTIEAKKDLSVQNDSSTVDLTALQEKIDKQVC